MWTYRSYKEKQLLVQLLSTLSNNLLNVINISFLYPIAKSLPGNNILYTNDSFVDVSQSNSPHKITSCTSIVGLVTLRVTYKFHSFDCLISSQGFK